MTEIIAVHAREVLDELLQSSIAIALCLTVRLLGGLRDLSFDGAGNLHVSFARLEPLVDFRVGPGVNLGRAIFNQQDEVQYLDGFIYDITAKKAAESEIERLEAALRKAEKLNTGQ